MKYPGHGLAALTDCGLRNCAVAFLLMSMLAGGCGRDDDSPPTMRYGADTCARCAMIVNEERFAAAYRTAHGEWRRFDDIGCLVLHIEKTAESVSRFWVHAHDEDKWLDAAQAYFVHSSDLSTPMGFGLAALARAESAQRLAAAQNGQVLRFEQLAKAITPPQAR